MSFPLPSVFQIKGLFGQFDVSLPFENNVSIFLGENGMGKTTILNFLYYVLCGQIEKLRTMEFDEIILTLNDGQKEQVSKSDIEIYVDEAYDPIYARKRRVNLESLFSENELEDIKDGLASNDNIVLRKYSIRVSEFLGIPLRYAQQELEYFVYKSNKRAIMGDVKKVVKFKKFIEENIITDVMYFPTYRRIEEDITKLGLDVDKDKIKDKLIQFGMTDVRNVIERLLAKIKSAAITGFTKMTGILLRQYVDEELHIDDDYQIDEDKLGIALDRIGDEIEGSIKYKIKESVKNGTIYDHDNKYLLNLIRNLISSYDKQNEFDDRVRKFVAVCNKYLIGKRYIYDESNVVLDIYRENSKEPINLQNLSSGEKQIISVFAKLYLDDQTKYIILFDEPELSLSIKWQTMFLPDLISSGKCEMLISVTHSPFIFENQYDSYASSMGGCITEKQ